MRKLSFCLLVVFSLQMACTVSRNSTPSSIGIVPLQGFSARGQISLQDTVLKVYRNDAEFESAFNASPATTKKPDFYGQMAVAVMTTVSSTMEFVKAETAGNKVNIYLESCTPSTQTSCQSGNLFLAAIPKVGSAKTVVLYIDNKNRRTVNL